MESLSINLSWSQSESNSAFATAEVAMSGAREQEDQTATKQLQQIQQHLCDLGVAFTALENGDEDSYQIPPAYVCMGICDELRNLGSIAKSSVPQLLTILELNATNDDQYLLHLRAAHAHFAITGEPGICLAVALRLVDVVSKNRFSKGSPPSYDELFWLRAWACDILGEMGAMASRAMERLNRLAGEDECTLVRKSARRAIEQIETDQSSAVN
jgi:hypothetical protein